METNREKKILYAIIAVLALVLWLKGCGSEKESYTDKILIPEEKGSFEPSAPEYEDRDSLYKIIWELKDSIKNKKAGGVKYVEVEVENPVDIEILEAYKKAKDSIERFKILVNSIQKKKFKQSFEDSLIKIDLAGEVRGDLNYISPSYTIKNRYVDNPTKKTFLRVLAGLDIENSLLFNDFNIKPSLGLQNQKGNVYRLGYYKNNGVDYFSIGFEASLFEIKR